MGDWRSTGILVAIPTGPFPEPETPDFPHVPLPQPRVSGCEWNSVHCPFKRVPVSQWIPASLADKKPAAFHSQIFCGHLFLALVLWTGEPSLGFRSSASHEGTWLLRCPSGSIATVLRSEASFFYVSTLPVLVWLLLQIPGYKTSLYLVFTWLFRMIVL